MNIGVVYSTAARFGLFGSSRFAGLVPVSPGCAVPYRGWAGRRGVVLWILWWRPPPAAAAPYGALPCWPGHLRAISCLRCDWLGAAGR